jgi:hypothetical protein
MVEVTDTEVIIHRKRSPETRVGSAMVGCGTREPALSSHETCDASRHECLSNRARPCGGEVREQ